MYKPQCAIIAANYLQFRDWLKTNDPHVGWDYFYVSSAEILEGRRGINYEFVGTWWERNDLTEIGDTLMTCNVGTAWEHKTNKLVNY